MEIEKSQPEKIQPEIFLRENILAWYDQHQRVLPWRKTPPNPYHVLLSEFMLQQTTVATVIDYFEDFIAKWPKVEALAAADDGDILAAWAGLGYYARARNLIKTVRYIASLDAFPNRSIALRACAGIGPYTAAAIASIAFDEAVLPQDGNINRILARVYLIDDPIDRPSQALNAAADALASHHRPGDLAQAMMDIGAKICRPKNPACGDCPIMMQCKAHHLGQTAELPKKAPKRPKSVWNTQVYIFVNDQGEIAYEKRAENALLGGMWGLPTSPWGADAHFTPPIEGNWQNHGKIRHIFTHIDLTAHIYSLKLEPLQLHNQYTFFSSIDLPSNALPKLWRKALDQFRKPIDNQDNL